MVKLNLDKRSVRAISNKLKKMPAKLQRTAIRKTIDPEAKRIRDRFKSVTPVGKRKHKNKYTKKNGSGFLKRSFSVRNSGKKNRVGKSVITRAQGYYIFMSPNETGRKAGSRKGYRWGTVSGSKKYSTIWKTEQRKTLNDLNNALGVELTRL